MTIKSGRASSEGFSLIELMVTLAVAAILLALAVPSFIGLLRDNQRSSAVNDLLADLTFARSESIRRGRQMIVCASADGTTCGSSSNWGSGWIVFQDGDSPPGSAPNQSKDSVEPVIRSATGRTASLTVTANRDLFIFRPFLQPLTNGTINFCDPRDAGGGADKHSSQVVVAVTGRPRVVSAGNVAAGTCP